MSKNSVKMPTVESLMERSKPMTVTMSLRVKETTKDFFEQQAKRLSLGKDEGDKAVTASTLVNALLDSYVENYGAIAQEEQSNSERMRNRLRKTAGIVTRMDDETLLRRVLRHSDSGDLRDNLMDIDDAYWVWNNEEGPYVDFAKMKRGEAVDDPGMLRYLFDNADMLTCDADDAGEKGARCMEDDLWQKIVLTPEKWIVVVTMTDSFVRNLHRLCPECEASLSPSMIQKLTELAAETDDRAELATKLAEFYGDYTEGLNE